MQCYVTRHGADTLRYKEGSDEALRETCGQQWNKCACQLLWVLQPAQPAVNRLPGIYALPLPVGIICRLLDIPSSDGTALSIAASRLVAAFDLAPLDATTLAAANEAALTLERYFQTVVAQRRAEPGDDIISSLVSVEDNGATLSDGEIVSNVILLFIAGHETMSNMIGNALVALFRQPAQLDFGRGGSMPSLAFGGGIHYCLGARLALLEMEVAIGALLARFPDMQPVNMNELTWHPRNNPRGVQSLRIATAAA